MHCGRDAPRPHRFSLPEWLIPWWRHIGEGDLWTLALRHRGHLVGLAPFYIYNKPGSPEREVFLVGLVSSDYLDALFDPAFATDGPTVVFAHLEAARQRWDVCDLQQLRSGSPLLHAMLPRGWQEDITAQEPCTGLALSGTVVELPRLIPLRLRKNLRNSWNRAERIGPVRIERAHEENLDELLEALFRLHGARWSSQGLPGMLASEAVRNAHRETAPALLSLGMLRLYGLRIADRLVASLYGFTHISAGGKRAYAYVSGFDPAFAQLSVGTLLLGHAVQQAMHEGAAEFDFLRGRETYKSHWRVKNHLTYRRRLWHASD